MKSCETIHLNVEGVLRHPHTRATVELLMFIQVYFYTWTNHFFVVENWACNDIITYCERLVFFKVWN